MIHENIELTGSFTVSGSFVLPSHASSSAVYETGSMYHDTEDGVLKVYTGTQWVTVGEQTASAAGGGAAASTDIEYLVVGGGAGGGYSTAGGGGAGGLLSSSLASVQSGSTFTVTIGSGGSGGTSATSTGVGGSLSSIAGASISTITTTVSGGGGNGAQNGATGASGGGGGYSALGASGTLGQGNDGGDGRTGSGGGGSNDPFTAGGGGGASTVGGDATNIKSGDGGDGKQSNITGTATYYAGGGGGGADNLRRSNSDGAGGLGGGGNGGDNGSGTNGSPAVNGSAGTANTGGGGGGGQNFGNGGSGGSGVAIFAYDSASFSGLGGVKTNRSDGYMVHTFNSSGTLTIAGAGEYPVANGSVFAPVIYTGNGSTQSITSVGFQPDLVWIKGRGHSISHYLFDSVRGQNVRGYHLMVQSNSTDTESARDTTTFESTYGGLTSLDTNGFTLEHGTDTSDFPFNGNSSTYVAWCWKAGGTAVSDTTTGDIDASISANTDAGFSIIKYTGSGTSGHTVPHGLSSTPELSIIKNLDAATNWDVSFNGITGGTSLNLDTTAKVFSPSLGYHVAGASTLTLNSGGSGVQRVNTLNENYIAYCFHSVDGYQKVGSYTGTNTTNAITTGFEPRFLMVKLTSAIDGQWVMYDNVRSVTNPRTRKLAANFSGVENDSSSLGGDSVHQVNFTSTGFELLETGGGVNTNKLNETYIYLAIA